MPLPTLLSYDDDCNRIRKLEERNESLQSKLQMLIEKGPEAATKPCQVEPPQHLLDDFYIIAQENNSAESQAKSFKSIIRNMGSGSSPILGRKDTGAIKKKFGASVSGRSVKPSGMFFYDN